jgi:histidinol-phosphate aminotransferase
VLTDCNFYPDNHSLELQRKLARLHGVQPEQVMVGAGLTAVLDIIARALLSHDLNAITSERSFIVYPTATRAAGGRLIEVPMRHDGYDLEAIAAATDRNTRIVFLANPNNPPGSMVPAAEVDRFLQKIPEHVLVVLDEAYYEFAQYFARLRGIEYSHSIDYVRQNRNVVILRTFSKAHGLAGVRIGYALGPAQLISRVAEMRPTFSVSLPAQSAASAAIDDEAHIRESVTRNAEQSELLTRSVSEMGYRVLSTWANFIYCEVKEDADRVAQRLRNEGVHILPLEKWGAPTAIRVTVGRPEQNEVFLSAFKKVMERAVAS